MRLVLVSLHRWFGLAAAGFLVVAGLTGALISWDHELDAWLNPLFYRARTEGPPLPALALARAAEATDPRIRVRYLPLAAEPGHTLIAFVDPRTDPSTARPYAVDYDQVALDPATGAVQARRKWGAVSLERENLLPFLYKLHYSLHLPARGGVGLGVWLMGLLAVAWTLDCAVALWISFPRWGAWRRSFTFRWRDGGHRMVFDLHRSGGVWAWLLVLVVAVTSVAMNLQREVMRPVVGWFSPLSPSPFDRQRPGDVPGPHIDAARVIALASTEGRRRGFAQAPGGLLHGPETGLYGVGFFAPGHDHGDIGLGNPWLYYDSRTGALVSAQVPGEGSAGDVFLQAMFPLHSGRIAGTPGRMLVSALGVAVAILSVTGVLLWARKWRARAAVGRQVSSASGMHMHPWQVGMASRRAWSYARPPQLPRRGRRP
jgi:uncharacterized iron-regulated membrane protein